MPGLDMSIEELLLYQGELLAPQDFTEFWSEVYKRVLEVPLSYTLTENEYRNPNIRYFDIEFTSFDGSIVYGKYIRPMKTQKDVVDFPLVLQFHDYKKSSRSWFHLSRYPGIGYGVLTMDCRGQGGKTPLYEQDFSDYNNELLFAGIGDKKELMYLYKIYIDALMLVRVAMELPEVDKEKIITYGEGQGGALALVCAALNSDIKKCGALYPMCCDFKRLWDMKFEADYFKGILAYLKENDPMKEKEIFDQLGYVDVKNFAALIQAEVLVGIGLQDNVTPPSAQFAIYNTLRGRKEKKVYPKHGHELNNFFENEWLKFFL